MEKEKITVSSKVSPVVAETAFDKAFHEKTTVSREIAKFLDEYIKGYKKKTKSNFK